MPQMMPMLWMNMFLSLIFITLMTYSILYFMNYYNINMPKMLNRKKWNWKW